MGGYIATTKSLNWMTPPIEIEQVILPILGSIDLDACCHPRSLIPSVHRFCGTGPDDDGSTVDWLKYGCRFFLNPTFGETWSTSTMGPRPSTWRPLSHWVRLCLLAAQRGGTVLALLPAHTDRRWFQAYMPTTTMFCLLSRRVRFLCADEAGNFDDIDAAIKRSRPGDGHMYALWAGHDTERYVRSALDVLEPRGIVVEPRGEEIAA